MSVHPAAGDPDPPPDLPADTNSTTTTTTTAPDTTTMPAGSSDESTATTPVGSGSGAVKSSGCGKTAPKSGVTTAGGHSITLDIPEGYDSSKPYKLVMEYPWRGGNMQYVATGETVERGTWAYYGLKQLDTKHEYIFVAVSGTASLAVTDAMLTDLEATLCIDTSRVFATGFSMGGMSSFEIACGRADKFRAVAALNGGGGGNCKTPIAIMITAGLQDTIFPYKNTISAANAFAKINGCQAGDPPVPAAGSKTHTVYDYKGCSAGHPTKLVLFDSGHKADPGDGTLNDDPKNGYNPPLTMAFFNQF